MTARRRGPAPSQPLLPFAEFAEPSAPALPPGLMLGTQGFQYDDWRGPFYPAGARPADMLALYARQWSAVEIDATFYAVPRRATVEAWRDRTPDGFVFAAKFPRSITHEAELLGAEACDEAARFVETMALLGPKRGPLLLQLGPSFTPEKLPALEAFVAALPEGARYAVEVRNKRWAEPEPAAALQACCAARGIAVALLDHPWMPRVDWITADFTYIRLLGDRRAIERFHAVQIDRAGDLDAWAALVRAFLRRAITTYVFANNHYAGHSPATVAMLRDRVVAAGEAG